MSARDERERALVSASLGGGIRRCECGEIMLEDERHEHELTNRDRGRPSEVIGRMGTSENLLVDARSRIDEAAQAPHEPEMHDRAYHYGAVFECGHWRKLTPSWNPVVEDPRLGPYEGFCLKHGEFSVIVGFVKLTDGKPAEQEMMFRGV